MLFIINRSISQKLWIISDEFIKCLLQNMPFEITIAIDPSKRIRKFMERPSSKNRISEKNNEEWTKLISVDESLQSGSSDKELRSLPFTVYRATDYESDYLSDQKECDNKEKDLPIFQRTGDSTENEDILEKSNSNTGLGANKKLTIVEPKTSLPGFFKRLFISNKKKENPFPTEIAQTEQNNTCDTAINAFNSLLENDNSLEALVGKAFSLNTMVTIQSIEDDGKPNLILSGSIPFQLTTKHGIVNKKVHVKGKLYSPRKEEENQTATDQKSNVSIQPVVKVKINEQFKVDSSQIEKVSWLTSKIFTQEEYKHHDLHCEEETNAPKVQTRGNMSHKTISNQDEKERLRYITNFEERESSLNIIGSGKLKSNPTLFTAVDHKKVQLPVTSITITRSKTRLIKFTDGTDFTEKVGRNVITLAAPEGILYFPEGRPDEKDDSYGSIVRRENVSDINCEDNMFTRSCFQMVKDDGEYALSRSINDTKRFGHESSKRSGPEVKDLDSNTYYPPGNYNHILTDRYNPLTWIYQNFDKTKRFVQEFNC